MKSTSFTKKKTNFVQAHGRPWLGSSQLSPQLATAGHNPYAVQQ